MVYKFIYYSELCYFLKYKYIYIFVSGVFFVFSVICIEIGFVLFCIGCVGFIDVWVICIF